MHVEDRFTSASILAARLLLLPSDACHSFQTTCIRVRRTPIRSPDIHTRSFSRRERMRDDIHRIRIGFVDSAACELRHRGSGAARLASAAAARQPPAEILAVVGASDTETLGELSTSLQPPRRRHLSFELTRVSIDSPTWTRHAAKDETLASFMAKREASGETILRLPAVNNGQPCGRHGSKITPTVRPQIVLSLPISRLARCA